MKVFLDIEIKKENEDTSVLTLRSAVSDVEDETLILVQMPIYQGAYYPLPRAEHIKMRVLADSNLLVVPVQFLGAENRGDTVFARLRLMDSLKSGQMRSSPRVMRAIPLRVEYVSDDSDSLSSQCRLTDISTGGVLFMTNTEFNANEIIKIFLNIRKLIEVKARVLRVTANDMGIHRWKVAVQFLNIDEEQNKVIESYIYNM